MNQSRQVQRKEARAFVKAEAAKDRDIMIRWRVLDLAKRRSKRAHLRRRKTPAQQQAYDAALAANVGKKRRIGERGAFNRRVLATDVIGGIEFYWHATKGVRQRIGGP